MEDTNKVKSLIQKGDVEKALDYFISTLENDKSLKSMHDYLLVLSRRFNNIQKENLLGTVSDNDKQLEINRICDAILKLINDLPSSKTIIETTQITIREISKIENELIQTKDNLTKTSSDNVSLLDNNLKIKKKVRILLILFTMSVSALLFVLIRGNTSNTKIDTSEDVSPLKVKSDTSEITDAFRTLFESVWLESPIHNDDKLPCFFYQGKWVLDKENPYSLRVNRPSLVIYNTAKSVDLYTWCKAGSEEKKELQGIELFTNEVSFIKNESKDDTTYIGIIQALFFDEIIFDSSAISSKPVKRTGTRIGRYQYHLYENENTEHKFYMSLVKSNAEHLLKTNCESISTKDITYGKELIKGSSTMTFNCEHTNPDNPESYQKHLIYMGIP